MTTPQASRNGVTLSLVQESRARGKTPGVPYWTLPKAKTEEELQNLVKFLGVEATVAFLTQKIDLFAQNVQASNFFGGKRLLTANDEPNPEVVEAHEVVVPEKIDPSTGKAIPASKTVTYSLLPDVEDLAGISTDFSELSVTSDSKAVLLEEQQKVAQEMINLKAVDEAGNPNPSYQVELMKRMQDFARLGQLIASKSRKKATDATEE